MSSLPSNPSNCPTLSSSVSPVETNPLGLSANIVILLQRYFKAHQTDLPYPGLYQRIMEEVERPLIKLTLEATRGNQVKAAYILGLNRNTLRSKIRQLSIDINSLEDTSFCEETKK